MPSEECDDSFADLIEAYEKHDGPLDPLLSYNPTQGQQSTNLYYRLIGCTTGAAFQIVESVPDHNGGEAWRLLNIQFDPKTDARLTSLVLGIIGHKIRGKDVHGGLVQWEAQVLALARDHQEVLSEKIRRALLMNVLLASMQSRIMEHMDRLKTYKEVRDKVVALSRNSEDAADIGNLDDANDTPPDAWEAWWQDENFSWREPEPAEEILPTSRVSRT